MRQEDYQIRDQRRAGSERTGFVVCTVWSGHFCPLACGKTKKQRARVPAPHEIYWGLEGEACGCAGGACPGVVAGVLGFGFFFTAGFFGGSLSSTTVFLGGVAGMAACAVFRSVRSRVISDSLAAERVSIRCANCLRAPSKVLRSFETD